MALIKISQTPVEMLSSKMERDWADLINNCKGELPFASARPGRSRSGNIQLLTVIVDERLIGTLELGVQSDCGVLKELVIHEDFRHRGLAHELILRALTLLHEQGINRAKCACLESHLDLFRDLGFTAIDSPKDTDRRQFHIAENPCIGYYLDIRKSSPAHVKHSGRHINDSLRIGRDLETYNFHTEPQFLDLHRFMLSQARKRVWLLCDTMYNPVINDSDTAKSLLRLVKSNPQAEIRILLADDKSGAGYYNPTINLAQRLNSYIEIRTLQRTGIHMKEMVTLVDYSASIYRKNLSDFSGFANFNSHLLSERMRNNFEHHWQFAKPSMHLRRLAI